MGEVIPDLPQDVSVYRRLRSRRPRTPLDGDGSISQASTKPGQDQLASLLYPSLVYRVHQNHGNRRRRGVAVGGNVQIGFLHRDFELLHRSPDYPLVRLMRNHQIHILRRPSHFLHHYTRGFGHDVNRKPENGPSFHFNVVLPLGNPVHRGRESTPTHWQSEKTGTRPIRSKHRGHHPTTFFAGLYHHSASAIAEQNTRLPVVPIHEPREHLRPDQQDGIYLTGSDQAPRQRKAVDEPGARCAHIESACLRCAQLVLNDACGRWEKMVWRRGCDHDQVYVASGHVGHAEGTLCSLHRQVRRGDIRIVHHMTLTDAGSGTYPLVGCIYHTLQVEICQHFRGQELAPPHNSSISGQ